MTWREASGGGGGLVSAARGHAGVKLDSFSGANQLTKRDRVAPSARSSWPRISWGLLSGAAPAPAASERG